MPDLIEPSDGRPTILIIDNNADEREHVRRAFEQSGAEVDLLFAADITQALELLHPGRALWPRLILTDLDTPGGGARVLVRTLKADARLRRIPVMVFTGMDQEDAVRELYDLRVNAYVLKAPDFNEFVAQVQALCRYWFRTVSLAPR